MERSTRAATGKRPHLVEEWTKADVASWLASIGASRFKEKFRHASIDGQSLLALNESDLARLGVSDAIARKRLELEINALRQPQATIEEPKQQARDTLPPPSRLINRSSSAEKIPPLVSVTPDDTKTLKPVNARHPFSPSKTLNATTPLVSPKTKSIPLEPEEFATTNVQLWISQLVTSIDKLNELKAMNDASTQPGSHPNLMEMIKFDQNLSSADDASFRSSSIPNGRASTSSSLNMSSTPHPILHAEMNLADGEATHRRRNSHWYEVMGPPESSTAQEIAQQVKLDLKFKKMRQNSRIIMPTSMEENNEEEYDDNEADESEEVPGDKPPWVIMPNNKWRLQWDIVIMLLVVYYGIVTPINMAFPNGLENILLDMTFNALFVIDIFINFFTAFRIEKGAEKGRLETRMSEIAKAYLKKWFWIDLVASIPLDVIIASTGSTVDASFNKLVRMLRGFKLIRVLRMSRIFGRLSQANQSNPAMLRLGKLFGMLVFMWHWMGCFYWLISGFVGFGETRWTPNLRYFDANFGSQYAQAFFWAVMATTGVGRDIEPEEDVETVFTIIAIVVGVLMYAFIVGSASTALANLDTTDAEKRMKIETINQFLKQRDVPSKLQKKIISYYEYMWSRQLSSSNQSVMANLHAALKIELEMVLNQKLIQNVPMFQEVEQNCLLSIISKLISKIFLPKEYVCLKGERGLEMFFIMRGRLEVLVGSPDKKRVILKDGDFFGERCLMTSTRRAYSIQALAHCELLVLHKTQFKQLLRQFPHFAASMQKYAIGQISLTGWRKIRHATKLVRMVNLLGGSTTFETMFIKLSETMEAEEDEVVKPNRSNLNGLKKRALQYSNTLRSPFSKSTFFDKTSTSKNMTRSNSSRWIPKTIFRRKPDAPLGLQQIVPSLNIGSQPYTPPTTSTINDHMGIEEENESGAALRHEFKTSSSSRADHSDASPATPLNEAAGCNDTSKKIE